MSGTAQKYSAVLVSLLLTGMLAACGSDNREGGTSAANVARVDEATCRVCHSTSIDPVSGTPILAEFLGGPTFSGSSHNNTLPNGGCQGCHGGGAEHNGVGPIPFPNPLASNRCVECHTNVPTVALATNFTSNCATCHTSSGGAGIHAARAIDDLPGADDCVGCHAKAALQHGNLVADNFPNGNPGVRTITGLNGEFGFATARNNTSGYRSHHIYNGAGVDPQNAQCIACHLEGKVGPNRTVVRDDTYHMADAKIHLRSGNTAITPDVAWDPANPNHTGMDNFCMSCHNSLGAVSAYANVSSALKGMTAIAGALPLSAQNPFGDQLKNAYDGLQRPQVVAVYEQFDTGNVSHHGVRGKKYTGRTRATAITANFTQFSGATQGTIHTIPSTGAPQVEQYFGNFSTSGPAAGYGPVFSGSRKTLYEAGLFVAQFATLDGPVVGDDSTLHCGDCHSVGQWKPGSTVAITYPGQVAGVGGVPTQTATTVPIGAHGSQNEYMLRTSTGTDALHTQSTSAVAIVVAGVTTGYTPATNGTYVCYLCHLQAAYADNNFFRTDSGVGVTSFRDHAGLHFNNGCDSSAQQSVGKVGYSNRIKPVNRSSGQVGTVFGYTCAHCHSSGNQLFGGIHGNASADGTAKNVRFLSYSTDGTNVIGSTLPGGYTVRNYATEHDTLNVVAALPYRFMGGTALRYNGGATASKWEAKTLNANHREGCYNLGGPTSGITSLWNTTTPPQTLPGGPGGNAILNNNGNDSALGAPAGNFTARLAQNDGSTTGWGSCGHHAGSSTNKADAVSTRSVQRPLVY